MSILLSLYALFLLIAGIGILLTTIKKGDKSTPDYSIIVAARNEEKNIPHLLDSFSKLDYPPERYEIILVNDASTDNTLNLMHDFSSHNSNVTVISLPEQERTLPGKKSALQAALEIAKFEIVIFTDADCEVSPTWLRKNNRFWNAHIDMVVGYAPEIYTESDNLSLFHSSFRRFTQLVSAGIYAAAIGLRFPFSCSGRNLAIRKTTLVKLGGYTKIKKNISGDDKQILNLIAENKGEIVYNYYKTVTTKPEIEHFSQQQQRRYGKFAISSLPYKILTLLVLAFYLVLPLWLAFTPLNGSKFFSVVILYFSLLMAWIINLSVHKENFIVYDLFFVIVYPYYLLYYTFIGSMGKWKWKEN